MRLLPFFVPLAAAETLGSWTISALSRQCTPSNTACTYTLTLTTPFTSTFPDQQQQLQQQQQTCTFTITSPDTDPNAAPSSTPASHTSFTAIPCHNSPNPDNTPNLNTPTNNPNFKSTYRYTLNGGWDRSYTFLTLVPTDTTDGSHAFFGYTEDELVGGRVVGVKEGVVYRGWGTESEFEGSEAEGSELGGSELERVGEGVGVDVGVGVGGSGVEGGYEEGGGGGGGSIGAVLRKKRDDGRGRVRAGMGVMSEGKGKEMAGGGVERIGKRASEEEGKKWQIKGLARFPDQGANTTTWQFTIVHTGGKETHCSPTSPTSDPVGSFYGIPCGTNDGADFKASWGNRVLTMTSVPHGTDAWFGFEQVSHNQWLGDSKKEPVFYTGCG
ncbi:predicted protein [Chaetomium globosum CBS 148.51]|uniref:Ubiquitin 3 binding protein But2 C-terminal domain-containing protein n=1 Tax=Chaetomium globosum (strain ATCC 6205 / CBS 148.51 / DSM 1962 / NBRC 6347 / NRRL 1970) TaxID=306901 RepID=Q2HAX4_CHAGB|nr:uncharacterized protein CHGG_02630 [Chaetomium globosum CBS 148.51]EAQ90695.1 predicted protein [Chaetomium globosum CBS 148.51]